MRDRESNTEPTTTSYALLGLLALRSWSAYELAGQMQRAIHLCWPRSERLAYAEPKRLVVMGLARQRSERVGQRRRTVYEITPAGRRALRAWLATTPAPPQLEFETMLRLIHGDHGTTDDLLRAQVRRWPSTKDLGMTAGTRRRLEGILARGEGLGDPA